MEVGKRPLGLTWNDCLEKLRSVDPSELLGCSEKEIQVAPDDVYSETLIVCIA